jgi:hypothetical protein
MFLPYPKLKTEIMGQKKINLLVWVYRTFPEVVSKVVEIKKW